jgi:hypothetical protein
MVDPGTNQLDFLLGKRTPTHGHARPGSQPEQAFHKQAVPAVARNNGSPGDAAF